MIKESILDTLAIHEIFSVQKNTHKVAVCEHRGLLSSQPILPDLTALMLAAESYDKYSTFLPNPNKQKQHTVVCKALDL